MKKKLDLKSVTCIIEKILMQMDVLHGSLLAVEVAIQRGSYDVSEYDNIIAANTDAADRLRKELRALTKALVEQFSEID